MKPKADKPPPPPLEDGLAVPVPRALPVPPEPTLAVSKTPAGNQNVAEKFAAAPPTDVCALPPPPPVRTAVTMQPLDGAVKFWALADTIPRPLPGGRTITTLLAVPVWVGVGVALDEAYCEDVCV